MFSGWFVDIVDDVHPFISRFATLLSLFGVATNHTWGTSVATGVVTRRPFGRISAPAPAIL